MSKRRVVILFVFLALYLCSYIVLSRRGFAIADRMGAKDGFWFFEPEPTASWEIANDGCVFVYAPLIYLDYHCCGGRRPSSVPLFGMTR